MKRKRLLNFFLFAALFSIAASLLRADVTIRYEISTKTGFNVPGAPVQAPQQSTIRMKGNRGVTTNGNETMIVDFIKQEVILIDTARHTYATIPAAQYSTRIAGSFPTGGSLHSKAESRITGRTETIQGVPTAEREIMVSMEVPVPAGAPIPPTTTNMVIQTWTAQADAVLRVPALRELTGFQQWQNYFLSPAELLEGMGSGSGLGPLVDELRKDNSLLLRQRITIKMPSIAAVLQQAGGGTDADAPFMEMNQEVVELSTAPVDGSLFEIPPGFQQTTFDSVENGLMQARRDALPQRPVNQRAARNPLQRFYSLGNLTQNAWKSGSADQTAAYARELLAAAARNTDDWNYGNAIHDGHMYLGLVALQQGDQAAAREELLEAGKTPGSPQLNSFGPNMALAYALLQKGDRDTVLEYFSLCRNFWKLGGTQLERWSDLVRQGHTPVFGANLQ